MANSSQTIGYNMDEFFFLRGKTLILPIMTWISGGVKDHHCQEKITSKSWPEDGGNARLCTILRRIYYVLCLGYNFF